MSTFVKLWTMLFGCIECGQYECMCNNYKCFQYLCKYQITEHVACICSKPRTSCTVITNSALINSSTNSITDSYTNSVNTEHMLDTEHTTDSANNIVQIVCYRCHQCTQKCKCVHEEYILNGKICIISHTKSENDVRNIKLHKKPHHFNQRSKSHNNCYELPEYMI